MILTIIDWLRIPGPCGLPDHRLRYVAEDRDFSLSNDFIEGIVFHPGDKVDALGCPLAKQGIVIISPIIDHDGPGSKMELRHDLHISHLALCDNGKRGEVAIMIQKQRQFDRSLDSAKFRPDKEGDAEVNDRGIETTSLFLNRNFFLVLTWL